MSIRASIASIKFKVVKKNRKECSESIHVAITYTHCWLSHYYPWPQR